MFVPTHLEAGDEIEVDGLPFHRDRDGTAYAYFVCDECHGEGRVMVARMYPTGHTECWEECEKCLGEGSVDRTIIEPTSPWRKFYEP